MQRISWTERVSNEEEYGNKMSSYAQNQKEKAENLCTHNEEEGLRKLNPTGHIGCKIGVSSKSFT